VVWRTLKYRLPKFAWLSGVPPVKRRNGQTSTGSLGIGVPVRNHTLAAQRASPPPPSQSAPSMALVRWLDGVFR
jgi:hypothetical protein